MKKEIINQISPISILTVVYIVFLPNKSYANAIIPYMVVPTAGLFLIPIIILIEAFVLLKVTRISFKKSLMVMTLANIASTLVGQGLLMLPSRYLWELWVKNQELTSVLIIIVWIILLLLSIVVEGLVGFKMVKDVSFRLFARGLLFANFTTYFLLGIIAFIMS